MAFPTKEMIHLNSPIYCYIFWGFLGSLVVRLIQCIIRAVMPEREGEKEVEWRKVGFCKHYWIAFKGCDFETGDAWLPYFVGVAELLAYPILFHFEQVTAIGAWIALKTAGNWALWQKRRQAYYSFLLGNIFIIVVSYFFMTIFIGP